MRIIAITKNQLDKRSPRPQRAHPFKLRTTIKTSHNLKLTPSHAKTLPTETNKNSDNRLWATNPNFHFHAKEGTEAGHEE